MRERAWSTTTRCRRTTPRSSRCRRACSRAHSGSGAERYEAALGALRERGVLYECFCSRADVRRAASAPHGPDGPIYGGLCRDLTSDERAQRRSLGRGPSLRVRMQGASGDIVVRRGDGVLAYQLAVVVDDAAQGVTHVVRGADLADSTARQLELYRLLSLEPVPGHAHVPLLLEIGRAHV